VTSPSPEPAAIAASMLAADTATRDTLGVEVEEMGRGYARIAMTVTAAMLNSAKLCHGGIIFALADTAVGFAGCSHGPQALSQNASITWLRTAHEGDRLTAVAQDVAWQGRTGLLDVVVTNQDGDQVALFRAQMRRMNEPAMRDGT
jgi:acyl-CoA thioesterase